MPTGQIGISIAGWGIAVDHVIADYVAGAAERLVLEGAERGDLLFVEGQGAILHPLYSGVTLGLLHGSTPHALVLVHEAGAERIDLEDRGGPPGPVIPPLLELADLLLRLTDPAAARRRSSRSRSRRGRIASDEEARAAIAAVEAETGLRLRRPGALRRRAPVARRRSGARMTDPRLVRYAQLICEHSLGIDESHRVHISTPPAGAPLALAAAREAWRRGARVSVEMAARVGARPTACATAATSRSPSSTRRSSRPRSSSTAGSSSGRPGNTAERAGIASARDAALARARAPWLAPPRRARGRGRAALGRRRVSRPRWARRPRAWARTPGSSFVYSALLLDEPDPVAAWRALSERHKRLIDRLAGVRELHVVSAGTDLRVDVEGRAWESCAGEANLPDGEVFCCPPAGRRRGRDPVRRAVAAERPRPIATCGCASRPASSSRRPPRSARRS